MDKSRFKTARPQASSKDTAPSWYRINNLASTGAAEIFIYDEISPWGVTAQDFVNELRGVTADRIDLHLNTPGGDVFDAVAIYQALRNHPAEVTVYVDSLAASSGSFVAMAGDRRVIGPHGTMMIHDAWGFAIGNAADMAKMAEDLDRVSANIASIYANRGGGDVASWREAMHAETWYTADEAVTAGLMHEVQADEKAAKAPEAKNRFDLSIFNYAGRAHAPAPVNVAVTEPAVGVAPELVDPAPDAPEPTLIDLPAAEPEPTTEPNEEDPVSDLSEFRSRLGLDETADETAILAALDERLNAAPPNTQPDPDPDPEPTPDPTPAPQPVSQPVAQVDNAPYADELKRLSKELAEIKAEKAATTKANVLDAAQGQGKFTPDERKSWAARYDKAPEVITDILDSLEPGTAVPVTAVGQIGAPEVDGTDAEFDNIMARLDGPSAVKGA